jgi:hypothetical protein
VIRSGSFFGKVVVVVVGGGEGGAAGGAINCRRAVLESCLQAVVGAGRRRPGGVEKLGLGLGRRLELGLWFRREGVGLQAFAGFCRLLQALQALRALRALRACGLWWAVAYGRLLFSG